MNARLCTIEGCAGKHESKGLCVKHYLRLRRHGDPLKISDKFFRRNPASTEDILLQKVDKTSSDMGCWLWTGRLCKQGYGEMWNPDSKSGVKAHRLSFELYVSPIPEGKVIDHKFSSLGCPTRCVNPEHLQAVSQRENSENLKLSRINKSGHRGVNWYKRDSCWVAKVTSRGVRLHLGYFPSYELHVAGYKAMMKRNELFTNNLADRLHSPANVGEKANAS